MIQIVEKCPCNVKDFLTKFFDAYSDPDDVQNLIRSTLLTDTLW